MKKKIILVEDDEMTLDIYGTVLEQDKRIEVKKIKNGEDFLLWLREGESADLFFLDIILPDITGMEILKKIKEEGRFSKTPVFIVSNYISSELKEEAQKLGAEKCITKVNLPPSDILLMAREALFKDENN